MSKNIPMATIMEQMATVSRTEQGSRQWKNHHKALYIAAALIGFGVCSAQAAHKDVKHCADDYRKFCHAWGLETKGLENCMRKHGDKLTNACIAALS